MTRSVIVYPILVGIVILVLTSCDKETDSYQQQMDQQQITISELNKTLTENIKHIEQLKQELNEQAVPQSELDAAKVEFPWLNKLIPINNTQWDKIVIHRYDNEPTVTIVDPLFLESIRGHLNLRSVGTVSYPSGYQTDIDTYTYDLYEGEQMYSIKVVDRGVIEAGRNELYFEVDEDISQLGAAFMRKQPYIQHDGLIAKMAASGAVKRGELYVFLSSSRVQSRVAPLTEGKLLKSKPEGIGAITERYTFYYYGVELVMEVYQDHVYVSGDGSEQWYELKDAQIILNVEPG